MDGLQSLSPLKEQGGQISNPKSGEFRFPARPLWAVALKRTSDLLGAVLGLVLLLPILVVVSVLVKIEDGGPVIYRRRVVGANGTFDAFKFRSMRPGAEGMLVADEALRAAFEENFKLKDDPRITRLGKLLRKYSLDEIPQLFNVLLGQMSLVGPRMVTVPELEKYGEGRHLLLTVKPGLTGYWQVNGRQNVGYSQRIEMDMYYIRCWSTGLDLRILLRTPQKVWKAEGAV
jgi:lipopolysaccharide/colanic/teichoic acid biosynthesis glycosyltransferase